MAALGRLHVVIEAIVRRRAEGDLRAGPKGLHRFCEHMREIMARQFQRIFLVARGDQGQLGIAFEGPVDIA